MNIHTANYSRENENNVCGVKKLNPLDMSMNIDEINANNKKGITKKVIKVASNKGSHVQTGSPL